MTQKPLELCWACGYQCNAEKWRRFNLEDNRVPHSLFWEFVCCPRCGTLKLKPEEGVTMEMPSDMCAKQPSEESE